MTCSNEDKNIPLFDCVYDPSIINEIKVLPSPDKSQLVWYIGNFVISIDSETAIRFAKTILKKLKEEKSLIVPFIKIRKISSYIDALHSEVDHIELENEVIEESIMRLHEAITEIYKLNK